MTTHFGFLPIIYKNVFVPKPSKFLGENHVSKNKKSKIMCHTYGLENELEGTKLFPKTKYGDFLFLEEERCWDTHFWQLPLMRQKTSAKEENSF